MKIPHMCSQCLETEEKVNVERYPIVDSGIYYCKCEKGHEEITVLQLPQYEVLFMNGLNAIVDDYYREAVSSFVASLERFYDFYIEAIFTKNDLSEDVIKEFKSKINLSERKVGAFFSLYTNENKKTPEILSAEASGFRNKVIHNGKIPTKTEAIKWAEDIQKMIILFSEELSNRYPDLFFKIQTKDIQQRWSEARGKWPNARMGNMSFGTPLTVYKNPNNKRTIVEILEALSRGKNKN